MLNYGARSDDADESPGNATDDGRGMFLAQDYHDPGTSLRQNPQGRQIARRIHGGGPRAEVLSWSAPINVQVRLSFISKIFDISNTMQPNF